MKIEVLLVMAILATSFEIENFTTFAKKHKK